MKRVLLGTILGVGLIVFPVMSSAQVHVQVNIPVPLPPPIAFVGPPNVVVLPGFDVYVVPDVEEDILRMIQSNPDFPYSQSAGLDQSPW